MESIDTYAEKIRTEVEEKLGDGHTASIQKVTKNNGVVLTGLAVKKEDEAVAPTIYLDGFYEDGREDAADEIVGIYGRTPSFPGDAGSISRFEDVSDKICYKLINTGKNEKMLKGMPHRNYMDLSAVYFISLDVGGQMGSIAVTDAIADMWGKTEEELWELAFKNTPRLFPSKVSPMQDVLSGMTGQGTEILGGEKRMLVITNDKGLNGAAAVFYDSVLSEATEYLGEKVFLIPSSIHEFLAVPAQGELTADAIREMVREINATMLDPKEVLSDSVYRYEKGGSIEIAGGGE